MIADLLIAAVGIILLLAGVLLIGLAIGVLRPLLRALGLPLHRWRYRNPADRACAECGLIQNKYCWNWNWNCDWWEDHNWPDRSKKCGMRHAVCPERRLW